MQSTTTRETLDQPGVPAVPNRQARRRALREFQRHLVERTQQARSTSRSEHRRLAVQAGDQRLLLDATHIAEIIPHDVIASVPHTRAWFLGLINYRGKLTGVVDFPGFLGQVVLPWQDTDRLLVLSDALPVPCALRVTLVQGLVSLSGFSFRSMPSDMPAWVTAMGADSTDSDAQTWQSLDLSLLMRDPAFLDVVAR